jgi:histidinol phosphatase-like PHP family hydrolase
MGFWADIAKPFADATGRCFLDARIHKKITRLKRDNPAVVIGETHCHSTFSDGKHSVEDILRRASRLRLDYVVITDHLLPRKYLIESIFKSWEKQAQYIDEWDQLNDPVKIYPALEMSALEGHLILIFDPEYLSPKKFSDISLQFSEFDDQFFSMLEIIPRIGSFGGISIVPHPNKTRAYPFGASIEWVKENLIGLADGIEDVSSGHGYQENYSEKLGLAAIGSSDDHFNLLTGTAVTAYDGNIHNNLINAVKAKETKAIMVDNSLQPLLKLARYAITLYA